MAGRTQPPRTADHSPTAAARTRLACGATVLALLAACSSPPRGSGPFGTGRDGPPAEVPADLADRPDPEPRVEPIRSGGPNKPYEVLGRRYTPLTGDVPLTESGLASWYGRKFHGRSTASGETYDMFASSAAHRTMPIPSYALVRNPANGREVVVRVNDRGPFHDDRVIDLSYAAALKLDLLRGVAPVEVRRLTHDDIRSGRWRAEPLPAPEAVPEASVARSDVPTSEVAAAPPPIPAAPTVPPPSTPEAPAAPATAATRAEPPAAAAAAPGYWVQLGAFRQREGAYELRQALARELSWLGPWLAVFDESALFRLQAGPYASRSEAMGAAERIRAAASIDALVLQRR